ncbi:PepSY domain-containing protein [Azoarcus indigens]|uniref:Putative iron-regulated membrane protein n=1 Tax=Azoarcus indigens TaxID=29545 RepID=A0A4R6E705_9RHOO|nr:PepSY-associated TM helix domain-containing protein [Azoarcus indigens]NMG64019.1 PepSY domain-containing protein [Azoarcus indigens]TDN53705.1 putative iron-regulated membrane protein [Azoarcus indigens]
MTAAAMRRWGWIHKWSSLVCTLFMLLLCLTGLPLIFSHEIDHLAGDGIHAPEMPADTPRASLDAVAQAAVAHYPSLVPLYFFAGEDDPNLWYVKLDTRVDTDESASRLVLVDARTAEVLGEPQFDSGFMSVMYRLHVDMYAGLPGKLFLGAMGLLLVTAIVSGVVLYAPFMRKLDFGTVRRQRATRTRWLDLHNLLGIVTVVWALVVGFTGVVNTWAELIFKAWQAEQVAALQAGATHTVLAPDAAGAAAADGSVQRAMERALLAAPGMKVDMIAFPGTLRSTPTHHAVLLSGDTPLTARLTQALLVDADNGEVLEASGRPWYVTVLQLSEPLHFGDYGGLPMKALWALLDLITIVVLGSGLYLWWRRGGQEAKP